MSAPSLGQRDPLGAADLPDLDVRLAGTTYPLIAPGNYDAVGVDWRKMYVFKAHKLAVVYEVLVPDAAADLGLQRVRLARFYNVRPGPERRVLAAARGDYLREWTIVAGRRPSRRDRLSPRIFVGVLVRVEVATVTADSRQHPLIDVLQYSRITRILGRRAGGGKP
jgi:hypothetical protein